jgi:hypothetical protein
LQSKIDAQSSDLALCFDFRQTTTRRANSMGLDPAHRAPKHLQSSRVISLLLTCHPEAVPSRAKRGKGNEGPMHSACARSAEVLRSFSPLARLRTAQNDNYKENVRKKPNALSAPQQVFSQALIKIYSLVDCPIYSVVKYRPRCEPSLVVRPWPLAKSKLSDATAARLSGYESKPLLASGR